MNSEAFILLSLSDASLTSGGKTENGTLSLNCVTMHNPEATNKKQRDVYLVLRVNSAEFPLDPARVISRIDTPLFRSYTFASTELEPAEILLRIKVPNQGNISPELTDRVDTFDSILEQYALDFRRPSNEGSKPALPTRNHTPAIGVATGEKDLRGHLVMINEDTGEIIGEVRDKIRIHEDPAMYEPGHRSDPVIIEVPDESHRESDANARQAFARLIPPDQHNWITKSASICSQAISMTTNLLVTTITNATDYYVSHSSPSPYHSSANVTTAARDPSQGASGNPPPVPPRPRMLVFLTSEKTQKGLSAVHTLSGEAVKMSSKTLNAIDNMIRRAMGLKNKRTRYFASPSASSGPGSASLAAPPPPPYEEIQKSRTPSPRLFPEKDLPPIPSRSPGPAGPPPLPYRSSPGPGSADHPVSAILPHQPKLTSKERIIMSLDLILSTVDDSARKLLDVGPAAMGKVMAHKYGPEAAHASTLLTGAARNVGLVYIDMKGMGRRALLRRAGKTWVKAQASSKK